MVVGAPAPGNAVVVVGGRTVAHVGAVKWSLMSVIPALRARARPWTVTLFCMVIEVRARMLPTNVEPLPRFAELSTSQYTLHSWAPLMRSTWLLENVVSVESVWKTNTVLGSPSPSSVSVEFTGRMSAARAVAWYTPPFSVSPERSGPLIAVSVRDAASVKAAVRSSCACAECTWSLTPGRFTSPGGKPVIAGARPGETPRFSFIVVSPTLLTDGPARTE